MKLSDFNFELPEELIAQKPSGIRGEDKLLLLGKNSGSVSHYFMKDLPDLISPDTLMIFNNSKVRRSRCYGIKKSSVPGQGGRGRTFGPERKNGEALERLPAWNRDAARHADAGSVRRCDCGCGPDPRVLAVRTAVCDL